MILAGFFAKSFVIGLVILVLAVIGLISLFRRP